VRFPGGAVDHHAPADRLDARSLKTKQPRPSGVVGPSDPVVTDGELDDSVLGFDVDVYDGRLTPHPDSDSTHRPSSDY
jgi:hypothetical protein